ncbi:MAG: hypothetical protein PF482_15280 [Desulfobacteraceae bacterium]|nr:hypothetical protein [Desulfobacteraceae bacterium]
MENQKIKFISIKELMEQEFKSKIHVDDKFITIIKYDYPIEKKRCNTPAKILSWILHLSEKNWIDNDTIHDFTKAAMSHANIERVFF